MRRDKGGVMNTKQIKNLRELSEALQSSKPVTWNNDGWTIEGKWNTCLKNFFHVESNGLTKVAEGVSNLLDELESIPVRFDIDNGSMSQCVDFNAILDLADMLTKKMIALTSPKAAIEKGRLNHKLLSLKYRLEDVNGGIDTIPKQQSLVNLILKVVRDWKHSHPFEQGDSGISDRDLLQIFVTSQYPEFVHLLVENKEIRNDFMLWTFRDGNLAKIFIEYPALQKKLVECQLNGRIGRVRCTDLKVKKVTRVENGKEVLEKIVTLPFEGVERNILDGSLEITFKGNYRLTVDEIFQIFKDKKYKVGNLEYLAYGVCKWNVHKWGYWSEDKQDYELIDLAHHQWWKQLPVFEIITQDEAFERYQKRLDGKEWCVSATATRGTASLDYENTHAFCEVAIPWGDGRYAIYDFGKFAFRFPSSFFEGVSIFCHNLHATVAYPDENMFYSHRQQTYQAFPISVEQGYKLMEVIKVDMMKSKQLNFVYQIESDNCAKWVHHHLEAVLGKENVPDMFRMHLLDTEPIGPVGAIFGLIKKLPKFMQTPVLAFFHRPMGAARETWIFEGGRRICKSLTRHDFWKTGIVYLPALLHKKKEEGLLSEIVEVSMQALSIFLSIDVLGQFKLAFAEFRVRFGRGIDWFNTLIINNKNNRRKLLKIKLDVEVASAGS